MRIGEPRPRMEDDRLLRGVACFTADIRAVNEAAMVVFRSPVAAGRILSLDLEAARSSPGVLAVLSGADVVAAGLGCFEPRLRPPGPSGQAMHVPDFRSLAVAAIRFVGQPVAIVLAETAPQGEDAAEAIQLDVEDRPAVVDCVAALEPGAPKIWDEMESNLSFVFDRGDREAVRNVVATAAHVARQRLRISRVTAAPIEPRSVLAEFDGGTGRYRLHLGTQTPHSVADELAAILRIRRSDIQVVARDCGGSFGMKNFAYPEYALALWAARLLDRPIRWTESRTEAFQADAHARDQVVEAALALDPDGRFLALEVRSRANLGAVFAASTNNPPTGNVAGMAGVYRIPAIHVEVLGVHTNTQLTAPYRGAGRPEATYVIERMIDIAAAELRLDRAELRRRNMIGPDQMPCRTSLGFTYDSGDFPAVLDQALAAGDWAGFEERRARSRARGRLRGIGIANPIEIAGKPNPEFARLEIHQGGSLTLYAGSMDTGQGHRTAFRQVLSQRLGVDPARIEIVIGDTDLVRRGTGTFGSRTLAAAGAAIVASIEDLVDELRPAAAEALEAAEPDIEFADGVFSVAGTDRRISFGDVAAGFGGELGAESFVSAEAATFPNGCHICEVEIDPETGAVAVLGYVVVDDVGTIINPLLVEGQIHGGVAQGVGQALMERMVYDPASGQLLSASFSDYAMPRAKDLPFIEAESRPSPTDANPLGVKGVGEAGTVGALPALISAICDALSPLGIRHIDMPASPERIWRAIRATEP